MVRRLVDVVCAAIALVATAPLLALAAVGIRRASPGAVLYRAERVGRGGRPFIMYKLRTMHARRRSDASVITGAEDPRVFPLGAWLRPLKIALDAVYVRRASLAYDARIVGRTLWVIVATLLGGRRFADPPELPEARRLLADADPASLPLPPSRNIATA